MAQLKNTTVSDTGFIQLPVGTTAQRPAPANGQMRFNTTLGRAEFYNAAQTAWKPTVNQGVIATGGTVYDVDAEGTTYRVHVFTATGNSTFTVTQGGSVEYLIVAGGAGGGGGNGGAGGGAGGLLTGTTTLTPQNYTVTVGSNGAARASGSNSVAFGLTAIGGGRGADQSNLLALNGGSGGGAGGAGGSGVLIGTPGQGTPGQGNAGGQGWGQSGNDGGGGGGGAGAPGANGFTNRGGIGGIGLVSFLSGIPIFYAGGGGGGSFSGNVNLQTGGFGGGGRGGSASSGSSLVPSLPGTPNTGGGGGGGGNHPSTAINASSPGGSGIVIVRYPLRQENPTTAAGKVVGDGLVLDLDFAKPTVYSGSGTVVSDGRLNGVTGTLVNSPVFTDARTHRSSFAFNNANDYIQIPHDEKLSDEIFSDRKSCTLEGWINVRTFQNWSTVINKAFGGSFSNTTGPSLWIGGAGFRFVFAIGVGGNPPNSSTQIAFNTSSTNQWFHLIGTVSGNIMSFYVNGSLHDTATITTTAVQTNTSPLVIGRRAEGSTPSLIGDIGIVRVYNRPLSATEVSQNYNATRWRFGV